MSKGMLRASELRKGLLFLGLVGTVSMHCPLVHGATILVQPQQTGMVAQGIASPERVGINIRDEAFVSDRPDVDFILHPVTDSVITPVGTPSMAWEAGTASLVDTSALRLALDRDTSTSSAASPDANPASGIHWFAFERRWLLPQASSLDEMPQIARAASSVAPKIQPFVNSSPIPLLPATQSALALGIVAGAFALIRRSRRAFR